MAKGIPLGDINKARVGIRNGKLSIYRASKGNIKALMPQMQRMIECSKQAAGLKGGARKTQMRSCLTR